MADRTEYIDRERLVREFTHLVGFDSESYSEREIADYLKCRLLELGLVVEEDSADQLLQELHSGDPARSAGNLYGYLAGNMEENAPEAILLSSHMDTVKPGNGKKAVIHEDGRITSDGTTVLGADDAAGLSEILEILTVIQEKKLPHPDIEIIFPVAEEPYAQGSRVFDYSKVKAKTAYVLDMSGPVGRAAVAAPSILSLIIHVTGKTAHAGFSPEAGIHAIRIAGNAITRIPQGHIDEVTTVNLGTIQGGIARNIVPDSVTITGEIRSLNHEQALKQAEQIRSIFAEEAEKLGGSAETEITVEFQAYRIREDEYVVAHFQEACRKLGLSGTLEETFGGSDNNHFTAHGIRGIVVANAMNEVHTTQEWTTIDEMVKAAELTLTLVTK